MNKHIYICFIFTGNAKLLNVFTGDYVNGLRILRISKFFDVSKQNRNLALYRIDRQAKKNNKHAKYMKYMKNVKIIGYKKIVLTDTYLTANNSL